MLRTDGRKQRRARGSGRLGEGRQRRGPQLPSGHVHNAKERHVVGKIQEHPQIGQGIAHFATIKKGTAAGNAVGNAKPLEAKLQAPNLMVRTINDGVIAPGTFPGDAVGGELRGNPLCFGFFVLHRYHAQGLPGAPLTP